MKAFLRRHILWAGFLAVLVPLMVLLALQYSWLLDLQDKSALAHEATLKNYLEAVASATEYYYRKSAERALNLPAAVFTEYRLEKAASFFEKRGLAGVRRFFVYSFVKDDWGKLFVYEPSIPSMEPPSDLYEARAVYVAAAPWEMLIKKGTTLSSVALSVDERDRGNRMILNPIVDDSSHVVGLAGMIVDESYFREEILPTALRMSMPAFFSDHARENLVISVRDARESAEVRRDEARRSLSFIFTDYTIGLNSKHMNPEQWARANFTLNMALSGLIAVVLLGGVALALRTASREMKLSQMKSDFVSNVSHELRTPLASIRVFGEFMRLGRVDSPEKVREYGEYVETESRRLTGLVNNILDFARIESGRKTYRFELVDLKEVIEETLRTFEVRLRHSGFRISLQASGEPLPPALIDADAISQAVGNLLDNAVKYSGERREVVVGLARQDGWFVISVEDQGIGISRDEQKKVFDRFHRVSTGLVHDVRGSGLGLSIVKHIAQAHGGRVGVDSEPGRGSTFTISLPVVSQEARQPEPSHA